MSRSFTLPITNSATRDLWKVAETGEIGQLIELLARGADVNASNQAGVTALMVAAYHGRLEMVRALTDHGADVNAVDKDGLTAAMLGQHSHREDIVSLLVARGARRIPKQYSAETSSAILNRYQSSARPQVSDAAEKRTVDQPPNIWDVVHETHIAFNPRSAFLGHLKSINPHAFALTAVLVGGAVVLGFIWIRGWSDNAPGSVRPESSNNQTIPSSPANPPETLAPSSTQQSDSEASAPVASESPSPQQSSVSAGAARLTSSALNQKVATPKEPVKAVSPKHDEPQQAITAPARNAIFTGTDKIENADKAQTSTTPGAKPDTKKSVEPLFENKQPQKLSTPTPAVRPRVVPTPNR